MLVRTKALLSEAGASYHDFWWHMPTRQVWAVEIQRGHVKRAAGPVPAEDVRHKLPAHLPYDSRDANWLGEHTIEFRPLAQGPY